jgi:large subunit ribosomal protein L4
MVKKLKVYNLKGEVVKEITAPSCLDIQVNQALVSKYVRFLLQKNRESIANTKDRSEVSGGGKKPWRQKGTGNARAGSNRSPIWVGGGVTFGPTSEKSYTIRMNAKERKQALLMTIVGKLEKAIVVDDLKVSEPKTKKAVEVLNKLPLETGKIMIFSAEKKEENELAFRNLPFVSMAKVSNLNSLEILKHDILIFDEAALTEMGKIYA